jgi:hypothetical protein
MPASPLLREVSQAISRRCPWRTRALELRREFLSAFVSTRVEHHVFSQVSGVSARLKKHTKQAKNEKNSYRKDLTRMAS